MEASSQHSEHLTPRQESLNHQVFTQPEAGLQQPFDITLVVEDGKEFKAHRNVLSAASPYFEKLLNSGMKEAKEGIVWFETYTEAAMGGLLEFIYTGNVQIFNQEIAIDLFTMADYLLLPNLKSLAEKFLLTTMALNASNCISTYFFAERYKLKELASKTESFIHANFITVAKSEEFSNLSNKEVEMWISRDEIHVSAEEDVFNIILEWIDCDKSERQKYFAELFCQVRLAYISRDLLSNDIVTNNLVKQSEGCLDLVKQALKLTNGKNSDLLSVRPRKSLENPFIVVCAEIFILCYFPRENRWCEFANSPITNFRDCEIASCCGKLYFLNPQDVSNKTGLLRYDSYSNTWKTLPYKEQRYLKQIFVRNDNEMFALVTEACLDCDNLSCLCCRGIRGEPPSSRRRKLMSFITRYVPESNLWEDIASFDFGLREGMCIVTKGNFVYFIGGGVLVQSMEKSLRDTERFDLTTNQWDKVADIQEDRMFACGAASHGNIFVGGGVNKQGGRVSKTCEVYDEKTNEWHFIASLISRPCVLSNMVCIDDKIYVAGSCYDFDSDSETGRLQCYDPEIGEWNEDVEIPIGRKGSGLSRKCYLNACSMRVFRGFVDNLDNASIRRCGSLRDKLKCLIM